MYFLHIYFLVFYVIETMIVQYFLVPAWIIVQRDAYRMLKNITSIIRIANKRTFI